MLNIDQAVSHLMTKTDLEDMEQELELQPLSCRLRGWLLVDIDQAASQLMTSTWFAGELLQVSPLCRDQCPPEQDKLVWVEGVEGSVLLEQEHSPPPRLFRQS